MANVPDQRVKVSIEQTQFLGGTTESLLERFSAASNWIVNNIRPQPVGSVVYSKMSEAQFQAVRGVGWILSDGRNVSGSAYALLKGVTNCLDLRGIFARGQNNGRGDGNQNPSGTALRGFQSDGSSGHPHSTITATNFAGTNNTGGASVTSPARRRPYAVTQGGSNALLPQGNQMFPKYLVMNCFVRIN